MEVEIISMEQIRPSSPTPHHLKIFKLSILDQLIFCEYAPIIFFYPKLILSDSTDAQVEILKTSLSKTLTLFYPLAGILNRDDLSILCNDVGAYFVRASVNCTMEQFLSCPDLAFLNRLLPCSLLSPPPPPTAVKHVTNVQVNAFECGGVAVALCVSHKIFDGASMFTFLTAWTSVARDCCTPIIPSFVSASMFPANDSLWFRDVVLTSFGPVSKHGNFITKRFVFDSAAINSLKERAGGRNGDKPSRVEVVSALLWKSASTVWCNQPSFLVHTVNIRRRLTDLVIQNSIGNFLWIAPAASPKTSPPPDLRSLANSIRESVSKIDKGFVKELQTEGEKREGLMMEAVREIEEKGKEGHGDLWFSSWCGFRYYEMDFGWGKPVWVCSTGVETLYPMNLVVLVDTRSGDGIEAWVSLDQCDMERLATDHQLLAFASIDPSPLL